MYVKFTADTFWNPGIYVEILASRLRFEWSWHSSSHTTVVGKKEKNGIIPSIMSWKNWSMENIDFGHVGQKQEMKVLNENITN